MRISIVCRAYVTTLRHKSGPYKRSTHPYVRGWLHILDMTYTISYKRACIVLPKVQTQVVDQMNLSSIEQVLCKFWLVKLQQAQAQARA